MGNKKKLGVIGGMGSRAGVIFLQKIVDYSNADSDQDFLEIIYHNNSNIPDRTKAILYNQTSPLLHLLKSVDLLNSNDVDVIVITCITSYYYYDQLRQCTNAFIINPILLIGDCIKNKYGSVRRVGLLATTGTINKNLFNNELNKLNIEIVTLDPKNQEDIFMRSVYMSNGLKSASVSNEAISLMLDAVNKMKELNVDLIIGGCTEVSIAIDPKEITVPYIDLLDLLAKKTVEECYK